MTHQVNPRNPEKRAADDVAADMARQLDEIGEHIDEAERQEKRIPENPLSRLAGDPTAIHEGPLSGGATASAADHEGAEGGE